MTLWGTQNESRVFGFIDDVVIRISSNDSGSQIDIRSVFRVDLGDLGQMPGVYVYFLALLMAFKEKRAKKELFICFN
jgi:uncharacterized protein DUF1499